MFVTSLTGFLVGDPRITVLKEGDKLLSMGVSVRSEDPDNRNKKPPVREIVDVNTFINTSSKLDQFLKKGTSVSLTGKGYVTTHEGKKYFKVQADSRMIELLPSGDRKASGEGRPAEGTTATPGTDQADNW